MSLVGNKMLPMSLEDISQAISEIRESLSSLSDSSLAEIEEQMATLQTSVDALEQGASDDTVATQIANITERLEAVETVIDDFFGA